MFCGRKLTQVARVLQARVLVVGREVGDARLRVVAHRPAELLELDLLARDRLDHVGAGDEHVRGLLHHEDEVGDGGGVDRAARARAHHEGDLRDHARAADVAQEHVAVRAERDDALLDPRAAGVVDPDDRAADLGRQVHDLAHLLGHDLAQRAAEDREVLREDAHAPAVDRAVAGDDRVAPRPVLVHLEVGRAVADVRVELLEGAGVEQLLDPLARRVLALGVLLLDRLLGGVVDHRLAQLLQLREPFLVGLGALVAHTAADATTVAAHGARIALPSTRRGAERVERVVRLGQRRLEPDAHLQPPVGDKPEQRAQVVRRELLVVGREERLDADAIAAGELAEVDPRRLLGRVAEHEDQPAEGDLGERLVERRAAGRLEDHVLPVGRGSRRRPRRR